MAVRLNVDALETKRKELKWTKGKMLQKIGVSRPTLWRVSLSPKHPKYNSPGEKFIEGTLNTFDGSKFEDFFFLD